MPRTAREKSESGIYHIMLRGINRQDLFEDDEDRQKFIEKLVLYKEKSSYKIYAYCLMSNHVHMLLHETKDPLSLVIKRISSSYVYYYNKKYGRCGHLLQERFKSEAVETDSYLLTVLRYIHQNPRKANMIDKLEEYKWSSYNEYLDSGKLVDVDYVLSMLAEDKNVAIQRFINFCNEENKDECLRYEENKRIDDETARELIKSMAAVKNIIELQRLDKGQRDEIIKKLKGIDGLSIRQIARLTGFSYSLVLKT